MLHLWKRCQNYRIEIHCDDTNFDEKTILTEKAGAEQPQWDEHGRVDEEIFFSGSFSKHHQSITSNGHLPWLSPVA